MTHDWYLIHNTLVSFCKKRKRKKCIYCKKDSCRSQIWWVSWLWMYTVEPLLNVFMSLITVESSEVENAKPNPCNNYCCKRSTMVNWLSFKNFCTITSFHQVARVTYASFNSSPSTTVHGTTYSVVKKKKNMSAYHEQSLFNRLQYIYNKITTNIDCPKQLTDYLVKWSQRNCLSLRDLLDLPLVKTKGDRPRSNSWLPGTGTHCQESYKSKRHLHSSNKHLLYTWWTQISPTIFVGLWRASKLTYAICSRSTLCRKSLCLSFC